MALGAFNVQSMFGSCRPVGPDTNSAAPLAQREPLTCCATSVIIDPPDPRARMRSMQWVGADVPEGSLFEGPVPEDSRVKTRQTTRHTTSRMHGPESRRYINCHGGKHSISFRPNPRCFFRFACAGARNTHSTHALPRRMHSLRSSLHQHRSIRSAFRSRLNTSSRLRQPLCRMGLPFDVPDCDAGVPVSISIHKYDSVSSCQATT